MTKKKGYIGTILLIVLIIAALCLATCEDQMQKEPVAKTILKEELKKELVSRDSLIASSKKSDSIRVKYIYLWRTKTKIIKDSVPYEVLVHEIINDCDSVILKDSLYISDLIKIIKKDSVIISNQNQVAKLDSATINDQNKIIKRLRRQRRILIGGVAILLGAVIAK